MPKQKIDLENLLAKYENGATGFTQGNFNESRKQMEIEESFYGKRTLQPQESYYPTNTYRQTEYAMQEQELRKQQESNQQVFVGNFKMSKQECENFLIEIQSELNREKKTLSYQAEIAYKEITERFNRNHEKIKREILELLDAAFRENEKQMKEELIRQSRNEPSEFNQVKINIQNIEEQISLYLRQLRSIIFVEFIGADYRKAISEVVLKDYTFEIKKLKDSVEDAKVQYIENLGEIEPDTARIECLKNDLKALFYFKKKTAKVIEKSIFSIIAPNNQPSKMYNESQYEPNQQQAQSRTRKSFFNFGS